MFAVDFEDSNSAECRGFMSALIRKCWICHHIINILNNIIKSFTIRPPVCLDSSSIYEGRCETTSELILLASYIYFCLDFCIVLDIWRHSWPYTCVLSFNFVFSNFEKFRLSLLAHDDVLITLWRCYQLSSVRQYSTAAPCDIPCQSTIHINSVCAQS